MGRPRRKTDGDTDLAKAVVGVVFLSAFLFTRDLSSAIFLSLFVLVCAALVMAYFVKSGDQKSGVFRSPALFSAPGSSKHNSAKNRSDVYGRTQNQGSFAAPRQPRNITPDTWSVALLRSLDWKVYEELCAGYFKATGRRAEMTGLGADGGVDIFLYKRDDPTKLISVAQCKAWSKKPIGVREIREFFGVMTDMKCSRGVYLTTSSYTSDAQSFVQGKRIDLVDGERFLRLIHALPDEAKISLVQQAMSGDYTTPSCPNCGTKLVSRSSVKGKNSGQSFWGCRSFPKCRYIMRQAT